MGVASLVLAIVGLLLSLVGLIPFLGIINWLALILLGLAFLFGILGASGSQKKGTAVAGLVLSVLFGALAAFRLFIGGGIF